MKPELLNLTERIGHKPILLMSDFDMTLANTYVFSERWQTHVPRIDTELADTLVHGSIGICVATARGALEPVSWMIGHTFLPNTMPLVVENGAALLWNRPSVSTDPSIELLVSETEISTITVVQTHLQGLMSEIPGIPMDHTVHVRSHRIASIELRAEHRETHSGTPGDYPIISAFLNESFPWIPDRCTITTTGSSLTIEPKSVNKRSGILEAMRRASIDATSIFPIGLGDNKNDTPIFLLARELGGIAIGVSNDVDASACDFIFEEGATSTKKVVQNIQSTIL